MSSLDTHKTPQVSIIVPAHNEAHNLAELLNKLAALRQTCSVTTEVIVVDNNSTDNTKDIVLKHNNVRYVFESQTGKGNALRAGWCIAKGKYLACLDGDNSYDSALFESMVKTLSTTDAGMVIGSRFIRTKIVDISFTRRFGNRVLQTIGFLLYGRWKDFLSGFYIIDGNLQRALTLTSVGFTIEAELFAALCKQNITIHEVPVQYSASEQSHIRPFRDGLLIVKMLIKERFSYA